MDKRKSYRKNDKTVSNKSGPNISMSGYHIQEQTKGNAYRKSSKSIRSQSHGHGYVVRNAVFTIILIQERDQDAPALGKGLNDGEGKQKNRACSHCDPEHRLLRLVSHQPKKRNEKRELGNPANGDAREQQRKLNHVVFVKHWPKYFFP